MGIVGTVGTVGSKVGLYEHVRMSMCVCVSLREKKPLAALNEEGRVKSSTPKTKIKHKNISAASSQRVISVGMKKRKEKSPSGGGGLFLFSEWGLRPRGSCGGVRGRVWQETAML